MLIAQFMPKVQKRQKKKGRHRITYRAARRNIAKIGYRRAKRGLI